jgi:hypothetical protein
MTKFVALSWSVRCLVLGMLCLSGLAAGAAPAQAQTPGTVTGRITRSDNSNLSGISVVLVTATGQFVAQSTPSASDGTYSLPVAPGTYYARTGSTLGFINKAFAPNGGITCVGCNPANVGGSAITVTSNQQTPNINFSLTAGGQITGTVRNASTNALLSSVSVTFYNSAGSALEVIQTNSSGAFTSAGLPAGSYFVRTTFNSSGLLNAVWDGTSGTPCQNCPGTSGTAVTVTGTAVTSGINFALLVGGQITGSVRRADNTGLGSINVQLFNGAGTFLNSSFTTTSGTYSIAGLSTGSYFIRTSNSQGFINVVYDGGTGATCLSCNPSAVGTAIAVTAGQTTSNINLVLAAGGQITGTVRNASTNALLPSVNIGIYNPSGTLVESAVTDTSGVYLSGGLLPGTYYVRTTSNSFGLLNALYDGAGGTPCVNCTVTTGSPVAVTTAVVPNINFALGTGGSITGTIKNAAGDPLSGVGVTAYDSVTGANGVYTIATLPPGSFVLKTFHNIPGDGSTIPTAAAGYPDKLYDGVSCLGCDVRVGTPVTVTGTLATANINFTLGEGGRIAGNIKNAATSANVSGVSVSFFNSLGTFVGGTSSQSSGNYFSPGLPPGLYFVRTTSNSAGLINQLYDNVNCLTCSPVGGTPVTVTTGAVTAANFALPVGGQITGTVRNAASPNPSPLPNISVQVYNTSGNFLTSTSTNPLGGFTLSGLQSGSYYVRTSNSQGLIDQVYATPANQTCLACGVATLGTLVTVTAPTPATTGIDFNLATGGSITGTVKTLTDVAIQGVQVQLFSSANPNSQIISSSTNASGVFTLGGLPTGNYYLRTSNSQGYINVVYDGATGATCLNCSATVVGSPIVVAAGSPTAIALKLATGKTISGTVVSAATGNPAIANVTVNIFSESGSTIAFPLTNGSGTYSATGLPAGIYYAKTSNSQGFIDQIFDGKVCTTCQPNTGTAIDLSGGTTAATANFTLTLGARISGRVTDVATGLPLASANVQVYNAAGAFMGSGQTNDTGNYTTSTGLPPGNYFAAATVTGYVGQLHSGIACSSCSVVTGTPIALVAGTTKTGIDFAMSLGGRVTGTITDSSSSAVPPPGVEGVTVSIYDAITSTFIRSGTSTASGTFSVVGLPAGTYTARTSNSVGYMDELYDDLKCATCSTSAGKPFTVTAGAATTGINFGLGRGGRITGTVRSVTGNALLPFVSVQVYNAQNQFVTSTSTNQNGVYTTSGMAPGTYFVRTSSSSGGFINQLYASLPCVSCSASTGTPVQVSGTETTQNINFLLVSGGSVSGRVTNAANADAGTNGLSGVTVSLYDAGNFFVGNTVTNGTGNYTLSGVPTGTYYAKTTFNTLGYINQLYPGIACSNCSVTGGTPVSVATGSTTPNINFAMTQGGVITGTVTDGGNSNAPIGAVVVGVYSANGQFMQSVTTGANGSYRTIAGLPAGNYFVRTSNALGFVDELYNDTTCLACNPLTGAPVAVAAGATVSGIDFSLATGGLVTGTVTSRATGLPLESISVNVYTAAGLLVANGVTNSLGVYKTGGMPPGTYYVRSSNSRGYIDMLYSGKDCTGCNPTGGTPVTVALGSPTIGVDMALASGGRIRGTVTLEGGAPAAAVGVAIFSASGSQVTNGFTDSSGNYVTYGGLPGGTYYARTNNSAGLIDELYDDNKCASCSPATGKPIVVTAGADTTGINYTLSAGGRISGLVTDTASPPLPVANARVQIYSSTGVFVTSATTGNSGRYVTTGGLAAGNYFVKASASGGLISALYKTQSAAPHNINCPACSPLTGSAVAVTGNQTTADIDFALNPGSLITGTVLDAASGVPLSGITVNLFDSTNGAVVFASTDSSGRYNSGSGLPAGNYYARTSNSQGYINQIYSAVCPGNGFCLPNSGTAIPVALGAPTTGVDFNLNLGGRVSGTVTDVVTGLPIGGASVGIFGADGKSVGGSTTDNSGAFRTASGLPTGTYFAAAQASGQGYIAQVYSNTTCISCDVTRGTPLTVTAGNTTSSINFSLIVGGGVSGRVTSTDTGLGLSNIEVALYTGQGTYVADALTNADGAFGGSGIPPGNYLLRTRNLQGFVDEAFDNVACAPCPMTAATATPITVTARTITSGINLGLDTGGLVTGIVTNSATGAPLEGVSVSFFQGGVFKGRSQKSDASGYYAISLPVGTYTVVPDAVQGYTVGVTPGSRTLAGTTVTVTKGVETPSVSFPLAACTPPTVSPSSLSIFTAGQPYTQTLTASGGTGPYSFSVSSGSLPPGLTLNAATGVISGTPSVSGTASFSVSASDAVGCAGTVDFTPFVCGVSVGTSQASYTSAGGAGILALAANSTDCTWTASSNAPWLTLGSTAGTGSNSVTYSVTSNPAAEFRVGTITVAGNAVTVTQGGATTAPPFGSFDTPATAGTLSGSVAVTGWALDDLGIDRVEIWRDLVPGETTPPFNGGGPGQGKVFIANPLFISGARPDVAAAFGAYPFANRAGWGYLMLTQGLWSQGNGTYTIYAFAFDKEGKSTTLGTKTLTVNNAAAVKPFGGIDTPTYGQTVSGSFWNFGWALTPGTCTILNGNVFMGIDSQPLVAVNYGDLRTDVQGFFPGFTNAGGASGAYYLDTTSLADGPHTIGWYVVDNCLNADGIGSRVFNVANGASATELEPGSAIEAALAAPAEGITAARTATRVIAGEVTVAFNGGEPAAAAPNADGVRVVPIAQGSRIALQLPMGSGETYSAYQLANGAQTALPIGSSFNAATGTFYWEPVAGYLGSYDLVFVTADGSAVAVRVVVAPPVAQ